MTCPLVLGYGGPPLKGICFPETPLLYADCDMSCSILISVSSECDIMKYQQASHKQLWISFHQPLDALKPTTIFHAFDTLCHIFISSFIANWFIEN